VGITIATIVLRAVLVMEQEKKGLNQQKISSQYNHKAKEED
jgi:hypothetical protein